MAPRGHSGTKALLQDIIDALSVNSLNVALGRYPGFTVFHKFARSNAIAGTFDDIWDVGGTHDILTSADQMTVVGNAVGQDVEGSEGASEVTIYGLDENYDLQEEVIALNSTNPVDSVNEYIHIYRMKVTKLSTTSTINYNAGDIDLTTKTGAVAQAKILAQRGQTLMSQYIVPRGHTLFINDIYANVGKLDDADITFVVYPFGESMQVKRYIKVYQNHISMNTGASIIVPEKSYIRMQAMAGTGTIDVASAYVGILADNTYLGTYSASG